MDKDSILAKLHAERAAIRGYGARSLTLFGSYARGEASPGSDLDFLVEFEEGRGLFRDYTGLALFLEDLFGVRVDLVKTHLLRPELRPAILAGPRHAAQI
ncbi:MAG: nucleotidyltransferase family protein [Thermodesulfobacteriota bacterium]